MSSLQIYQWVCQWKNFENRLTFGEVMGKSLVSCFFWDTVYNLDNWYISLGAVEAMRLFWRPWPPGPSQNRSRTITWRVFAETSRKRHRYPGLFWHFPTENRSRRLSEDRLRNSTRRRAQSSRVSRQLDRFSIALRARFSNCALTGVVRTQPKSLKSR